MEKAARDGNTENHGGLASGGVSVVLEMAVTSQASGRQEAGKQGLRGLILRMAMENPTWGSTTHSR